MADLNKIDFLLPNKLDSSPAQKKPAADKTESVDFGSILQNALKDVNDAQVEADEAVQQVLAGETKDIHETMIALQKADVSLRLMLEVRNKIMEAYQEVIRTQL